MLLRYCLLALITVSSFMPLLGIPIETMALIGPTILLLATGLHFFEKVIWLRFIVAVVLLLRMLAGYPLNLYVKATDGIFYYAYELILLALVISIFKAISGMYWKKKRAE
ncbi:hypothetical protein N9R79_01500 [Vibrio sp.]|nr:hypothetical protein [Vibrio sp.]